MKKFILISLFILSISSISVLAQTANPKVNKYVALNYPAAARAVGASGTVDVNVKIGKEGKVISAEAVSGHPLLRKACEITAKEWIFSSDSNINERSVKITFLFCIGDKNKKEKVKFKKPYTLELVGVQIKIDKHPGY